MQGDAWRCCLFLASVQNFRQLWIIIIFSIFALFCHFWPLLACLTTPVILAFCFWLLLATLSSILASFGHSDSWLLLVVVFFGWLCIVPCLLLLTAPLVTVCHVWPVLATSGCVWPFLFCHFWPFWPFWHPVFFPPMQCVSVTNEDLRMRCAGGAGQCGTQKVG